MGYLCACFGFVLKFMSLLSSLFAQFVHACAVFHHTCGNIQFWEYFRILHMYRQLLNYNASLLCSLSMRMCHVCMGDVLFTVVITLDTSHTQKCITVLLNIMLHSIIIYWYYSNKETHSYILEWKRNSSFVCKSLSSCSVNWIWVKLNTKIMYNGKKQTNHEGARRELFSSPTHPSFFICPPAPHSKNNFPASCRV